MEENPAPIAAPEPATGQAADPIPNLTPVSSPAPVRPVSLPPLVDFFFFLESSSD